MARKVEDPTEQTPPQNLQARVNGRRVPFDSEELRALQEGGEANGHLTDRGVRSSGPAREYLTAGGINYPEESEWGNRSRTVRGVE